MKTISVHASQNYDVLIGADLLNHAGEYIRTVFNGKKAAIISDSNVWPIYGENLVAALENVNIETVSFVFSAG